MAEGCVAQVLAGTLDMAYIKQRWKRTEKAIQARNSARRRTLLEASSLKILPP